MPKRKYQRTNRVKRYARRAVLVGGGAAAGAALWGNKTRVVKYAPYIYRAGGRVYAWLPPGANYAVAGMAAGAALAWKNKTRLKRWVKGSGKPAPIFVPREPTDEEIIRALTRRR